MNTNKHDCKSTGQILHSHLLLKPLVNEMSLYDRPRLMPELELEDVEVAAAAEV